MTQQRSNEAGWTDASGHCRVTCPCRTPEIDEARSAVARAERAEAQIRAVEELQGPLNQLQMTWWSDYPGAEHEKEAARRTLVHQLVKGLSAALAAGLSLQEEQE